jgi:membrane protease YdiL (CAAX protease family)
MNGELPATEQGPQPEPVRTPERYPFWGYSDLLLFAGMAVPAILAGSVLVKLIVRVFRIQLIPAAELLAGELAAYTALLLVLLAIFRLQYDRPLWESVGWKPTRIGPALLVAAGLVTAIAVAILAAAIKTPITENAMTKLLKDRESLILVSIFGVTIGPLAEELVFRGFLQPLLVRSLGIAAGIVVTAIPFGMMHYWQYGRSWRHVVLIAAAGAAFGSVKQSTGSTKASTIMHAAYNAVLFIGLFLQRRS